MKDRQASGGEPPPDAALATDAADMGSPWRAQELRARPGFLVRRLHQIHVALFQEECAAHEITPVQYSLLTELSRRSESEQAELARTLGLDRTNTADVVARLKRRGLVERRVNPSDKRSRLVRLTGAGRELLAAIDGPAERAHARTVEALAPAERAAFLDALVRLVEAGDDKSARMGLKLR